MKTIKNNSIAIAQLSLSTMNREELRQVAQAANVKRGKNTKDTVANLVAAIGEGKLQFKSTFVIADNINKLLPNQPVASHSIFQKKFRNYNGGDKVEFTRQIATGKWFKC